MRPRARVLLAIPLGLVLAAWSFLYGPTVDVYCSEFHRPSSATVDGLPGAKLCVAPSPAAWVLMAVALLGTPLTAAALDLLGQVASGGTRRRGARPTSYVDAEGNRRETTSGA